MDIEADARCELCGALRFGDEVDTKASYDSVEMLRRLADIWLQDPVALGIVLARVAMPTGTYREIGIACGVTHVTVQNKLTELASYRQSMASFAESKNPHAQARKRSRHSHV